jgi:hypothetical protein
MLTTGPGPDLEMGRCHLQFHLFDFYSGSTVSPRLFKAIFKPPDVIRAVPHRGIQHSVATGHKLEVATMPYALGADGARIWLYLIFYPAFGSIDIAHVIALRIPNRGVRNRQDWQAPDPVGNL